MFKQYKEREYFIYTPAKALEELNAISGSAIQGEASKSPIYKTRNEFVKINATHFGEEHANRVFDMLKSTSVLTTRTWA